MRSPSEIVEAVEQGKREIRRDFVSGNVPFVSSFSELHDYVDANEYGGLCADRADWEMEDAARVQDLLDVWLREATIEERSLRVDPKTGRLFPEMEDYRVDGDPCNDCGRPSSYDAALGWYVHDEDDAPSCFLIQYRRSDHAAVERRFQDAAKTFLDAARKLEEVWHDDETGWNADERLPLSRPFPLSLDEWILELAADWKIDQ